MTTREEMAFKMYSMLHTAAAGNAADTDEHCCNWRYSNAVKEADKLLARLEATPDPNDQSRLDHFRSTLRVGDLAEFNGDGRWQRRKITDLVENNVVFLKSGNERIAHSIPRSQVWPAQGHNELM
jgi:hypothetical protein